MARQKFQMSSSGLPKDRRTRSKVGLLDIPLIYAHCSADMDHDATLYDTANASVRETLRNDKKPFSGMTVCCSGVRDKAGLLAKARELGATCSSDLTDLTTHLVADVPGSAKYKVRSSGILCRILLKNTLVCH